MPKSIKLFLIFFVLLLVLSCLLVFKQPILNGLSIKNSDKNESICFIANNQCFNVEIAQTAVEKEKGLMFRQNLDSNKGMLFIYQTPGIYSFWMKNTIIPLDIIWIGENKTVVYIKENAEPCKTESCEIFIPNEEAIYVLEINAGLVEKYNLTIGEKVNLLI